MRTGIVIDEVALEHVVDQDRELARGGRDRLGFADARGQSPIERPEGRLRPAEARRRERKAAAARFAEGCVCELRSRPPDTLFFGASVSHEVKCCALGHRRMSVPISATSFEGGVGAMPSICVRSTPPVRWWSDGPDVEGGVGGPWLARDPWCGQRLGRRGDRAVSVLDVRFDGAVARLDLPLTGVEEFQILLEREEMLRPVVAGQRRGDLGLVTRDTGRGDACASCAGSRSPATMARMIRSPVCPVMSLITEGNWRFICISAFCIRWMCIAASSTRVWRCRM